MLISSHYKSFKYSSLALLLFLIKLFLCLQYFCFPFSSAGTLTQCLCLQHPMPWTVFLVHSPFGVVSQPKSKKVPYLYSYEYSCTENNRLTEKQRLTKEPSSLGTDSLKSGVPINRECTIYK